MAYCAIVSEQCRWLAQPAMRLEALASAPALGFYSLGETLLAQRQAWPWLPSTQAVLVDHGEHPLDSVLAHWRGLRQVTDAKGLIWLWPCHQPEALLVGLQKASATGLQAYFGPAVAYGLPGESACTWLSLRNGGLHTQEQAWVA